MESIIAIGALVTSSAAVYIAWDQAGVMHTEQRASVLPALQIDKFDLDEGSTINVGFNVENAGVGPAFIQSATLTNKGEPVEGQEHLTSDLPNPRGTPDGLAVIIEPMTGRVIAPGVMKQAMLLRWASDSLEPIQRSSIYTKTDGFALEICFCDTLKNCWVAKSESRAHPKQISGACPAPKKGGLF